MSNIENFDTLFIAGSVCCISPSLGALQFLQDRKMSDNIKTFVGYSSGCIISYLLCIGYTPIEIIINFINGHGFHLNLRQDLTSCLTAKSSFVSYFETVNSDLEKATLTKKGRFYTFKELYEDTGKTLVVLSVNVKTGIPVEMSHLTHPDTPVLKAISMSCRLPFVFEENKYNGIDHIDGVMGGRIPRHIINKYTKVGVINIEIIPGENDDNVSFSQFNPSAVGRLVQIFFKQIQLRENIISEFILDTPSIDIIITIDEFNTLKIKDSISRDSKSILDLFSEGYRVSQTLNLRSKTALNLRNVSKDKLKDIFYDFNKIKKVPEDDE